MELEPKIEIKVSWRDIGRAIIDLLEDRFANPYPLIIVKQPSPPPEE